MSIVKSAISNNQKVDLSHVPTGKEIADLQTERARLHNDIDALVIEFNGLSAKKSDIQKEIKKEQDLYDSMVVKPHTEMQAELDKKTSEHHIILQSLNQELQTVNENIKQQTKILEQLNIKISDLEIEIENRINKSNEEFNVAKQTLVEITIQVEKAQEILKSTIQETEQSKNEASETQESIKTKLIELKDYEAFLDRKTTDLNIWEKRLSPKFKEQYPNKEMRFV